MNGKDTLIFWVGSVYGSALVAFNHGSARLLLSIMSVWIFDRNVLFNAAITAPHPARRASRADIGIFLGWFGQRASIKRCAFIGLGLDRHVIEHLRQIVNRIGGMFPA